MRVMPVCATMLERLTCEAVRECTIPRLRVKWSE